HDDDVVLGAGLTFIAGIESGVDTYAEVFSNGEMGYCSPEEKDTIAAIRKKEAQDSYAFMGLPAANLTQFAYNDSNLPHAIGRRFASDKSLPNYINGAVGIENSMTWVIRKIKPSRIFVANRRDLHPDHQAVSYELMISIYHAQGAIWPELGEPIERIPNVYEYATYSDFISTPNMHVRVSDDLVEKRLQAVALYKSQRQIDLIVNELKKVGGNEYLLETKFEIFNVKKYENIFNV
ncbi:MAG: PIG-L family deacetylase, partial [Planctomycetaceae bacterium]|nr:PIG-L family deacetylase [Planctomycetaceae bacterium]